MFDKKKSAKSSLFSLRNTVFLSIILTCIVAIGNITQDILFDMQEPSYIELTREVMVHLVVTATPDPIISHVNQIPCRRDSLLYAIEVGGEIDFDCNTVILIDEPIVIRNRVHIRGAAEILTTLSQAQTMPTLFTIEAGGSLTLENIAIREVHGQVINVLSGGEFVGRNCRFANNWIETADTALILNQASISLSQCVFEENLVHSSALIWNGAGTSANILSTVFQANRLTSGDFTGEGSIISNHGGTMTIDGSYFLNNVGDNAENWMILSRAGQSTLGRNVFRHNTIALEGEIIANEVNSSMYLDSISIYDNLVFSSFVIRNEGNLRIMHGGVFSGNCINHGVMNDLAAVCS